MKFHRKWNIWHENQPVLVAFSLGLEATQLQLIHSIPSDFQRFFSRGCLNEISKCILCRTVRVRALTELTVGLVPKNNYRNHFVCHVKDPERNELSQRIASRHHTHARPRSVQGISQLLRLSPAGTRSEVAAFPGERAIIRFPTKAFPSFPHHRPSSVLHETTLGSN